jgi:hypothetical protein
MSLILDALRKSDRQRNHAASEQLRWAPGPARPAVSGQLLVGLIIALVLAIAGAVGVWVGSQLASTSAEFTDRGPERGPAGGKRIMENAASGNTLRPEAGEVRSLSGELAARRDGASALESAPINSAQDKPAHTETPVVNDTILHAPALSQMPEDYRAGLPALTINVHAWTEQPGQRFILINMQRYAEGDRLREGPLVRQITRDGVVLEHRGEIFSLSQR